MNAEEGLRRAPMAFNFTAGKRSPRQFEPPQAGLSRDCEGGDPVPIVQDVGMKQWLSGQGVSPPAPIPEETRQAIEPHILSRSLVLPRLRLQVNDNFEGLALLQKFESFFHSA